MADRHWLILGPSLTLEPVAVSTADPALRVTRPPSIADSTRVRPFGCQIGCQRANGKGVGESSRQEQPQPTSSGLHLANGGRQWDSSWPSHSSRSGWGWARPSCPSWPSGASSLGLSADTLGARREGQQPRQIPTSDQHHHSRFWTSRKSNPLGIDQSP
jgi:hypothetical protein